MIEVLFKYLPFAIILATCGNAFILQIRAKKYIQQNPDLRKGYRTISKTLLTYGNIPWLIMLIGNLSGLTQNIFEYFNPKTLNPLVLCFHFSIVMLWILIARWVYIKDGAEFMEKHPGLLQRSSLKGRTNMTAKQIKRSLPIMLLAGVIGMLIMWILEIPTIQF